MRRTFPTAFARLRTALGMTLGMELRMALALGMALGMTTRIVLEAVRRNTPARPQEGVEGEGRHERPVTVRAAVGGAARLAGAPEGPAAGARRVPRAGARDGRAAAEAPRLPGAGRGRRPGRVAAGQVRRG